ncbi:hypothetical protein GCM10023191_058680 [Actinoallomurus oryzae]|uniref:Uncharacterized protein n=1 Tax=Actinoallomurus oryzae TaxID=502180 RepID=A0ABP8QJG0_9ACTN
MVTAQSAAMGLQTGAEQPRGACVRPTDQPGCASFEPGEIGAGAVVRHGHAPSLTVVGHTNTRYVA